MNKEIAEPRLKMQFVGGKPYLDLDEIVPVHTMPDIVQAAADSYHLVKQNTWQKTTFIDGKLSNCNWPSKTSARLNTQEIFALELKNKSAAPMWILDLTEDRNKNEKNLYDSVQNTAVEWDNIRFRTDLPQTWNPFLNWLQGLDVFEKIGRTNLLFTRPGLAPQYHRDIGVSDQDFQPYKHRQEFIWLKVTQEKTLFILTEDRIPVPVKSRSAYFDHQNWHGTHLPVPFWGLSFKVEGIFTEKVRHLLGLSASEYNN